MNYLLKRAARFARNWMDSVVRTRVWELRRELAPPIETLSCLTAEPLVHRARQLDRIDSLREAEFRVFSQFGEDGIIQYLIHRVPIVNDTFVEFGVEDYTECNTRFLLTHDNWRGLVMDGSAENISRLRTRRAELFYRHELTAIDTFITVENINTLISSAGIRGDIGLLSVDIDGNDYWVWKAVEAVSPRIVVCEYNSVFGSRAAVTIPYDPGFDKRAGHFSDLYFGASLGALAQLAGEKGYDLVGSNSAGNNAFFVRKDVSGGLPKPSVAEAHVVSRFRSSRDRDGRNSFLSGDERKKAIADMEVLNLETGGMVRVGDLD